MTSVKRKRSLLSEKYKAEVESRAKSSNLVKKYGVPRNTISIWPLFGNEEN